MSGIPIYTQSPINASKASGPTPQTQSAAAQPPQSENATQTVASTSSYPPAKPGQAAVPAPTGSTAQRYTPLQPTPTTKNTSYEHPPAPQPGARPVPTASLPPPPKAGEIYHSPQITAVAASVAPSHPAQMSIPPPPTGLVPSSTSTSTTASHAYPVPVSSFENGAPRKSLEHPPGYQQNSYASELTPDQRRVQDAAAAADMGEYNSSEKAIGTSDGLWNTAKGWIETAGEKLQEGEKEIWRRINKE